MAGGGRREGAGRKAGVPNKRTEAETTKAEREGIMPKEVMLAEMRYWFSRAEIELAKLAAGKRVNRRILEGALRAAREAAKDAAPYYHARLATVQHRGDGADGSIPIRMEQLNDHQLNVIIARIEAALGIAATAAGVETGAGPEETEGHRTVQ